MKFTRESEGLPARRPRGRAWRQVIAAGLNCYDRNRHLARILPIGPKEIADLSPPARRRILLRLAKALRDERNRGRAGHWTYDLNRHIALNQAHEAERRALSALSDPRRKNETAGGLPPAVS